MRIFIVVIFVLYLLEFFAKLCCLSTGEYNKPRQFGPFAVDTILCAAFAIWAGFLLWY